MVTTNNIIASVRTKNLIKIGDSASTPAGKITILAIKAAKIAQAVQLNHLKILDFSFIFYTFLFFGFSIFNAVVIYDMIW